MREFKDATSGVQREIEESMRENPKPKSKPAPTPEKVDEKSVSQK